MTVNNQTPLIAFDTTNITSPTNGSNPQPGDPCHTLAKGAHPPAIAFDCKASGMAGFGVGEVASTMRSMGAAASHANGGGHLAVCVTGAVTHALKAEGFDASEDGTGRGQPIVAAFHSSQSGVRMGDVHATLDGNNGPRRHSGALIGSQVRRLTPREAERLQGFPDDHTLVTHRGKPAADGPRYKSLGNSMAVPVMRWIGRQIDFAHHNF